MATTEARLRRLEGGFEHLATKADVANLKVWLMGLLLTVVVSVFPFRRDSGYSAAFLAGGVWNHHALND